MLLKDNFKQNQEFVVPPKMKLTYHNFKLFEETSCYKVFEAEAQDTHEKHSIRILDRTKEYVNQNYAHAATLFVQELLHLQYRCPGSVLTKTFEISENDDQIACATLPYISLSHQICGKEEVINPADTKIMKKLLSDVLCDVEFLWNDFHFRKIMKALGPENILFMKEKSTFFLGNWAKLYESIISEGGNVLESKNCIFNESEKKKLSSQDLAAEIKALAFAVLKLKQIDYSELEDFAAVPGLKISIYNGAVKSTLAKGFSDSENLRDLIRKMLSLDPRNLPKLEELRIKGAELPTLPNKGLEESKQSKSEPQRGVPKMSMRIVTIGNTLTHSLSLFLKIFILLLFSGFSLCS